MQARVKAPTLVKNKKKEQKMYQNKMRHTAFSLLTAIILGFTVADGGGICQRAVSDDTAIV
ncbi:hypothetical protein [Alishewanella longhuensis]